MARNKTKTFPAEPNKKAKDVYWSTIYYQTHRRKNKKVSESVDYLTGKHYLHYNRGIKKKKIRNIDILTKRRPSKEIWRISAGTTYLHRAPAINKARKMINKGIDAKVYQDQDRMFYIYKKK